MEEYTCCFLGHRDIENSEELKKRICVAIEKLINEEKVSTFLFGSKSKFNDLCHEIVNELKKKYPHIKRVYVRAEFPYIDDEYEGYLLKEYEKTYYPKSMIGAGRAVYIERNCEMINKSKFCIIYFDENYVSDNRKSGMGSAYNYETKKKRDIINCFKEKTQKPLI